MKNEILAGSNTSASVPVGAIVPLTTTIKRFNRCGANSEVDRVASAISIDANCKGSDPRYNVDVMVTFAGASAGNGIISVYQNGIAIPFANATGTITTATSQYITVTIPTSIKVDKGTETALTIVNTGAIGITVINTSIRVVED
jgi:hypothetical protein